MNLCLTDYEWFMFINVFPKVVSFVIEIRAADDAGRRKKPAGFEPTTSRSES